MPELPEVETICRGLQKHVIGLKITGVTITLPKIINITPANLPDCPSEPRYFRGAGTPVQAGFRKVVTGKTVTSAQRRAKVIIIGLSDNYYLVIHLKISGQLLYLPRTASVKKHTHIIFDLNNHYQLRFWDQRRFGYVKLFNEEAKNKFLEEMRFGPEPLEKPFTLECFKELLKSRPNGRIKPLLMDQSFISGIGNLYADEVLFYAKVHPLRRPSSLTAKEIAKIYEGIRKILRLAIKKRGSSLESYVDVEGKSGGFVPYIKAYNREDKPCLRCKTTIKRIKIGSRSAYFCPHCQRV